ncbi:hypothetical protein EYS14_01355 [Alteromonadaceae bacterium M269]|nr:hypothetical protein EYS14_01355 [Alteromonadaceae bacterium M269]
MNNSRVFLSVTVFIIGVYLILDMFLWGFNWVLLVCGLIGFIGAHYLWPAKHDKGSTWYDLLEVIVELPSRAIALFLRGLGRAFKNDSLDLDI